MTARTTIRTARPVAPPLAEPVDRSMLYFELAVSAAAIGAAIILFALR